MQGCDSKKALLIMPALYSGGAEKQYRYIMEALSSREWDVTVLLLNSSVCGQAEAEREYILSHQSICFVQLKGNAVNNAKKKCIIARVDKLKSLFAQRRWLKEYLKKKPNCVVMFSYLTQLLMVPLFQKHKVKTIYNERNTGRQVCDRKYKMNLLSRCDKVVSNSKSAAETIEKKCGRKVQVINNGIIVDSIEKSKHEGYNIIVPARITPIKNQIVAVEAMNIIQRKASLKEKVRLILAGACEDKEYLDRIRGFISEQKLDVDITGYISDMRLLYEIADIVLLPSYEEGTPNVLLEAYMYGITPLVSNIPMNRACCDEQALLFDPNNAQELAEKIIYHLNQDKPDKIAIDKRLSYVVKNFGINNMAMQYEKLFSNLIE